MGHGNFLQTSFLGGLWGKLAQGRMESPNYKQSLDVCQNYYPVEQGSLLRRQGTRYLAHTRRGNKAKLIPFDFSIVQPYQIEFTNLFARFYMGTSQVFTNPSHFIINISTTTPAVITTSDTFDWNTGDDVVFAIAGPPCRATPLCNRQFTITKLTTSTFSIADALTGAAIDGSTLGYSFNANDKVFRILELASPYTTSNIIDRKLHYVQDETTVLFLRKDVKPYVLAQGGSFFTLTAASFKDGPYYDENTTTTTFTPSATSGTITVTASSTTGINSNAGFASTDVGRLVRLRSQAANWSSGTTYAVGDLVTGTDGNIYSSLTAGNLNHNPIADITNWAISSGGIIWNWGNITVVTDTTHVTVALQGDTALLNTTASTHWRMGLFSDTTGWPTCGGYHVGRLWLGGVAGNRFDASKSNDHYNFAPTASDGTVADDNAIAGTFTAQDVNQLLWFSPQEDGLYAGTQAGIWRIKASGLDDPITPTSVDARRVTKFQAAEEQAFTTPSSMLFVQRQKRKVLEYLIRAGVPEINNLTDRVEQLTVGGIEEFAYLQEPNPTIWALRHNGQMIGCSYKRTGDNAYAGWHEVFLGSSRLTESISVGPDAIQLGETLYVVTADPTDDTKPRFVEMLTPMFDSQTDDWNAFFVDTGIIPCCGSISGNTLTLYGLSALEGKSVCPFIAGVDVGPITVSGGAVAINFGSDPDGVFTNAFLAARSALNLNYGDLSVNILAATGAAPGPTVTSPSIMAYIGTASGPTCSVTGVNANSASPDWDNNAIYFYKAGATATDGLRKFILDPPATNAQCTTVPQLTTPRVDAGTGGGFGLMNDKSLIYNGDTGNSSVFARVITATLSYDSSFGVSSASTSPSDSTRVLYPRYIVPMTMHGALTDTHYLVSAATKLTGEVWVKQLANFSSTLIGTGLVVGNASEPVVVLGVGSHCAYGLGTDNFPGGAPPSTTAVRLYRINQSSLVTIGTFNPPAVDATWTNFSNVAGLAFDQTDGNLITCVETTDAVTNKHYIVKINALTAAVMWKVAVNNIDGGASENMWRSRVKTGTYFYIGSGGVVYTINTRTGASSNQTITGLVFVGSQISDDVSNSVIHFGSYSPGTLAYLGDWMATQGNHSTSNMWQRVFLGTVGGQDRTTLNAQTIYTVGAPVGQCYTSQFKLLRPDFGNDAAAQAGPAFGKKRRLHWWSGLLHRTQKISIGVDDFTKVRPVKFETPGRTPIVVPTLFSGTVSTTVGDNYDFDGQICGVQTTAYPSIIPAVGGYLSTQDK